MGGQRDEFRWGREGGHNLLPFWEKAAPDEEKLVGEEADQHDRKLVREEDMMVQIWWRSKMDAA
jgi:hypothetical protein